MLLSSIFSRPLEELEGLPEDQFNRAAEEARVSPEKLREILARTRQRYIECEAKKVAIAKAEAVLAEKFRTVPLRLRRTIELMQLTPELEIAADRLEREAYDLLDRNVEGRETSQKFFEARLVIYRGRLHEFCTAKSLSDALRELSEVCSEDRDRLRNVPKFREAAYRALERIRKELAGDHGESNGLPIDGPALAYSVNVGLNFPFHPRPRRYNDSLDHY